MKKNKRYKFGYSFKTDSISVGIFCKQKVQKKTIQNKRKKKIGEEVHTDHLKNKIVVGVDPGKAGSIVYMTTDDNKEDRKNNSTRLKYTPRQRFFESGATNRRKIQEEIKLKEIRKVEDELSLFNTRTTNIEKFQEYLKKRYSIEDQMYKYYTNFLFRIHRWWNFQGRQKSEARFVKSVKEKFGNCDKIVLAYGNWSSNFQMKGCMPALGAGFKNMLAKHFTVINTPEAYTTKTCSRCEERNLKGWLKRENKNGVLRTVRGIRRCQNEKCGVIFDRDYNAAINIKRNLQHFILYGNWNPNFVFNISV